MALPVRQIDGVLAALVIPASRLGNELSRCHRPTGIPTLDINLGGGWRRGAVSEVAGGRSAGRTSVLHASLAAAINRGEVVALVDAAGVFDPRSAERAGVTLSRLLWVRATGRQAATATALQAADLLVAAGGFGLVAMDLGERPARVPDAAWLRLRHAAERQGTVVLAIAPRRIAGAAAATAVVLHGSQPRFVPVVAAAAATPTTLPPPPALTRRPLLEALETRAIVARRTGMGAPLAPHAPPTSPPPPAPEHEPEAILCFRADAPPPPPR